MYSSRRVSFSRASLARRSNFLVSSTSRSLVEQRLDIARSRHGRLSWLR
jgi:hypothetical protein